MPPLVIRRTLPDILTIIGQEGSRSEVEHLLQDPNHPLSIAEKEHYKWIDSVETFSLKEKKILKLARICLLTAKMYPFADTHRLAVNNHYFMWTFIIDTVVDRESNEINDQVAKVYDQLLNSGGNWATLSAGEMNLPHVKAMADLVKRTLPHLGPCYRDMYIDSLGKYMHSRIRESRMRRQVAELQDSFPEAPSTASLHDPRIPPLSARDYVKNRRESVGTRAGLDILRWVHNIRLTPEELKDERFEKMVLRAGEFTSLINDLYSFKKEFLATPFKPIDNLIWIALHDPTTSTKSTQNVTSSLNDQLQAGVNYLAEVYTESYQVFQEQVSSLIAFPPACVNGRPGFADDVRKYAEKTLECTAATATWSTDKSHIRYSVYATPELRKRRILEFSVPE
ncbi:isoprenoid synthase domain-containing protein [Flagelloscypha sp. PMI_526]|nr:isoprenoid synthase domain-containing protein [Flagelloscypha sp. PMI_526]